MRKASRPQVVEHVGVSTASWEEATRNAIAACATYGSRLCSAELVKQDLVVEGGLIVGFRVRLAVALEPGSAVPLD